MTTTQAIIAQTGKAAIDYTLEFRTWNGSAYAWTDYTDRLVDFSGIGSTIEENAFPNAFRMSIGRIELDNTDGRFDNLDVLDGKLYNSAEPYGKGIYKRMVRITDVRDNESKVIGVGLVRDCKPSSHKRTVIIETISLDARASDQICDGVTAERHPLGGTDKTALATWTTSNPASATGNVNLYRWREQESEDNQLYFGWFKDRHYGDIIERTAWALDDLATDITRSYRLMTEMPVGGTRGADDREIATTRNIPPDDPAISTGWTTDRCRALVWNPERNVLVCCVGHLIYDYTPLTNVYTLRNTLTAGRDVQRAFYTTEADSAGKNKRIVLVQCDMVTYAGLASRVATAWCTVLDATGTGAYAVLANETSLGTDVFPGTHNCREGDQTTSSYSTYLGKWGITNGENAIAQFRSRVDILASGTTEEIVKSDTTATIFTDFAIGTTAPPQTVDRSYNKASCTVATPPAIPMGLMYPSGGMFSCSLNIYHAGGRLYFHVWDSANLYRLKFFELYTYTFPGYLLQSVSAHVPHFLYSPQDATWKKRLYCCQMEWKEVNGAGNVYSVGHTYYYDLSTTTWTEITFISGATGNNQAWMITELAHHDKDAPTSPQIAAVWFNRETRRYRFASALANSFSTNEGYFATSFDNGIKDQENRLEGLHARDVGTTSPETFFVEAGRNVLWSYLTVWGSPGLWRANKTPKDPPAYTPPRGAGDPINSDRGLGSMIVSTPRNYPDTDSPKGVLFWMSANDYIDVGADHLAGRYILCQYANFDPGFIELLDLSGLSFWELRTLLAERFGFVHYYAPDGTLIFKPRVTSGAASFNFSSDNRNVIKAEIQTRGFEAIINDVTVYPYAATSEDRPSAIVKGYNEASVGMDGKMDWVSVSGAPGENSQWRVVFISATTYDLYKLQGANFSFSTAKATAQSINSTLRAPTDGLYLAINPENFIGVFVKDDNFTFWVLLPRESLSKLDDRDRARIEDTASSAGNKRVSKTFDNRFIPKLIAGDYAANILVWRKDRHDVVRIEAVSDPNYLPLLRCTLKDENMGYTGTETFQIMGVEHRRHQPSNLILVKV